LFTREYGIILLSKLAVKCYIYTMRYAILGDIHGNLEAFNAVLSDIKQKDGFDKIIRLR